MKLEYGDLFKNADTKVRNEFLAGSCLEAGGDDIYVLLTESSLAND